MTDEQIIQELKAGKYTSAIKALYKHFAVVRQLVLKNSGSKQDAEDIYQESLIILFRKVKESDFVLTSALSTFLIGICRLQWMNELRKRNKSATESLGEIPVDEAERFAAYLDEESKFKQAEKALSELGEKCRDILRLFYFDKLDFKTIASKVGLSNERVAKNQKYRCLEKARENYLSLNVKK
ncbi:MAG TPA: sigma-70 family RNA polymerase sigma factor [Bacteroidia bacterium]|nr:sigma-70 family RNA polymerase sigma factor [Bacteroidia bacterium]